MWKRKLFYVFSQLSCRKKIILQKNDPFLSPLIIDRCWMKIFFELVHKLCASKLEKGILIK
jgi:hypothetical protein